MFAEIFADMKERNSFIRYLMIFLFIMIAFLFSGYSSNPGDKQVITIHPGAKLENIVQKLNER